MARSSYHQPQDIEKTTSLNCESIDALLPPIVSQSEDKYARVKIWLQKHGLGDRLRPGQTIAGQLLLPLSRTEISEASRRPLLDIVEERSGLAEQLVSSPVFNADGRLAQENFQLICSPDKSLRKRTRLLDLIGPHLASSYLIELVSREGIESPIRRRAADLLCRADEIVEKPIVETIKKAAMFDFDPVVRTVCSKSLWKIPVEARRELGEFLDKLLRNKTYELLAPEICAAAIKPIGLPEEFHRIVSRLPKGMLRSVRDSFWSCPLEWLSSLSQEFDATKDYHHHLGSTLGAIFDVNDNHVALDDRLSSQKGDYFACAFFSVLNKMAKCLPSCLKPDSPLMEKGILSVAKTILKGMSDDGANKVLRELSSFTAKPVTQFRERLEDARPGSTPSFFNELKPTLGARNFLEKANAHIESKIGKQYLADREVKNNKDREVVQLIEGLKDLSPEDQSKLYSGVRYRIAVRMALSQIGGDKSDWYSIYCPWGSDIGSEGVRLLCEALAVAFGTIYADRRQDVAEALREIARSRSPESTKPLKPAELARLKEVMSNFSLEKNQAVLIDSARQFLLQSVLAFDARLDEMMAIVLMARFGKGREVVRALTLISENYSSASAKLLGEFVLSLEANSCSRAELCEELSKFLERQLNELSVEEYFRAIFDFLATSEFNWWEKYPSFALDRNDRPEQLDLGFRDAFLEYQTRKEGKKIVEFEGLSVWYRLCLGFLAVCEGDLKPEHLIGNNREQQKIIDLVFDPHNLEGRPFLVIMLRSIGSHEFHHVVLSRENEVHLLNRLRSAGSALAPEHVVAIPDYLLRPTLADTNEISSRQRRLRNEYRDTLLSRLSAAETTEDMKIAITNKLSWHFLTENQVTGLDVELLRAIGQITHQGGLYERGGFFESIAQRIDSAIDASHSSSGTVELPQPTADCYEFINSLLQLSGSADQWVRKGAQRILTFVTGEWMEDALELRYDS